MKEYLVPVLFFVAVAYCAYCFTGLFLAILELIK
jgi:hypothetical protein